MKSTPTKQRILFYIRLRKTGINKAPTFHRVIQNLRKIWLKIDYNFTIVFVFNIIVYTVQKNYEIACI